MLATFLATFASLWPGHFNRIIIVLFGLLILLWLEHHSRDRLKHFLDIDIVFCARFKKWHVHQLSHALSIFGKHHFGARVIILVANWNKTNRHQISIPPKQQWQHTENPIFNFAVLFNFIQPSANIVKAFAILYIIDDNNAVCASIISVNVCQWRTDGKLSDQLMTIAARGQTYVDVIVRKRSCPAVSQICSFTFSLSMMIVRILKSTPMVEI